MTTIDTLVTDLVCGMTIQASDAVTVIHEGTTYSFCEWACAETFRDDPERWITQEPRPAHQHQ